MCPGQIILETGSESEAGIAVRAGFVLNNTSVFNMKYYPVYLSCR